MAAYYSLIRSVENSLHVALRLPRAQAHPDVGMLDEAPWLQQYQVQTCACCDLNAPQIKVSQYDLDACFVPSQAAPGLRADTSQLVILGAPI